ncbi:DUF7095 family protein [Halopenitus persicus]|uniref:Uncharacterized protein n=1 Tax=Halopenitus persicus TaxID=1048396 RepID=A0A1H3G4U2_9EURY|nr:hypothetical protein [Halopenitus persicus]QHS16895.1 hypothetical protein GWK26_06915 [haloarchaeon 3A1-DGR]SDX98057.1 hypothetical protein SAMN05216564_102330 [Halopenitus persicus]
MDRTDAIDRVETILETVESDPMPVPVREVWVYGDVALGLDPIDRLDVYVTKDVLLGDDREDTDAGEPDPDALEGVRGIGKTIRTEWAQRYPDLVRTNPNGYAAPEKCLAAHLLPADEPVHLEVCNTGFDRNVTQRLNGAVARETYAEVLDPRGVCLWVDGERDDEALERLREGSFAMPTLEEALSMLGADDDVAAEAAETVHRERDRSTGSSVRGDVV